MFHRIVTELRFTDTFFPRLSLAFACTLYGMASWNVLGVLFFVVGLLAWWRLFDRHPRLWLGTIVNLCIAALWITIAASNTLHGQPLADNVGEILVCMSALFVLTRTDLTATDKGSA